MPVVTNDSFRKIRVESNSGAVQGVLAADQALDTLTLVAGLGITITPNETGDRLVLNTVGAVNTATINDILFNGNESTFGLTVGSLTVDDTVIDGNAITANHVSNNLTLTTAGSGIVAVNKNLRTQSIIPQLDVTFDLGSSDYRFKDLYLSGSSIYLGSATITASGSAVTLPAGSTIAGTSIVDAVLPAQGSSTDKFLRTNGSTVYWADPPSQFPDQTGATGKSLTSNGSTVGWTLITPTVIGLGNVTNESKATMFDSPTFTGIPLAPTALAGTNTQQVATTEYVTTAVNNIIDAAPGALDTLNELAAAIGDDANYATTVTNALGAKAPIASPTFTGTAVIPTLQLTNALGLSYGGTGATGRADALTNLMPSGATAGYVLKTGGSGSYYWAAETGASTIVGTRIDSARQAYTATALQVLFEGCPAYTIGANQLRVYINGVRQFPEAYAETSTTSFTLTAGVGAGTKILAEVDGYVSNQVTATAVSVTPVGAIGSTNVQDALSELDSEKAPLDSPAFTGTPSLPSGTTAVTQTAGDNSTKLATTAYVKTAVDNLVDAAPGALDTLNELAAALGDDASFSTTVTTSIGLKAPIASPTFTGTATIPTIQFSDSTQQTTANRWVYISSGSETTLGGSNLIALTNNDITYGQYSKIQITAAFTVTQANMAISSSWYPTLFMNDGSNTAMNFVYSTAGNSNSSFSGASYAPNTYSIIYFSSGSMGRTSSGGPTLRFTWTINCPSTSGWLWFDCVSSAFNTNTGTMSQLTTEGMYVPGTALSSGSVYRPYVTFNDSQGRFNGYWEVYGMKK